MAFLFTRLVKVYVCELCFLVIIIVRHLGDTVETFVEDMSAESGVISYGSPTEGVVYVL